MRHGVGPGTIIDHRRPFRRSSEQAFITPAIGWRGARPPAGSSFSMVQVSYHDPAAENWFIEQAIASKPDMKIALTACCRKARLQAERRYRRQASDRGAGSGGIATGQRPVGPLRRRAGGLALRQGDSTPWLQREFARNGRSIWLRGARLFGKLQRHRFEARKNL